MTKFLSGLAVGLVMTPLIMYATPHLFWDVDPSDWYVASLNRLVNYEIIHGYQDGTFQPHKSVSRAELAVVIDRVMSKVDEEYTSLESGQLMEVTLFFTDLDVLIEEDCSATKEVQRMIPVTNTVADAVLRELFKGVTPEEEDLGMTDSFSNKTGYYGTGVDSLIDYYQGVILQNETAIVSFSEPAMAYLNSAACSQQSVKSPIVKTLQQFPSVTEVQFSVGGQVITGWDG